MIHQKSACAAALSEDPGAKPLFLPERALGNE
jgi:hypothetical protein